MSTQEQFYQDIEKAIQVADKHRQALLQRSGVVAVGVGPERRRGQLTGKAAIVITVRKKLARAELDRRGIEPLPRTLQGIPVDVLELDRPVEAPEIRQARSQARHVLSTIRQEWLEETNVTGVGIGFKKVKGKRTSQIALRLYVETKLPPEELERRNIRAFPKTIDGVPTDVIQLPKMTPSLDPSGSRADRWDPLVGGISIGTGNRPFWRGTLGAVVFDRTSGEQRILSNEHVLDGAIGEDVIQPAPVGLDDSIEVGFQLDICNPLHFFRLDTPNTPLGTILAGGAVAAVLAAALSDEIDPTRRGQQATPPPPSALTLNEQHKVHLEYPELPIPGTHFAVKTEWDYTRQTNQGDMSFGTGEERVNPHALLYKALFTDRTLYHPGDVINLVAYIVPEEGQEACRSLHPVALLTPTTVDRLFPVVLRAVSRHLLGEELEKLFSYLDRIGDARIEKVKEFIQMACLYTGKLTVRDNIPVGPWRHYLYVQTVNDVRDNVRPEIAAQTIGGLPVSQNMEPNLDVGCGPFIFEDGSFDIELI